MGNRKHERDGILTVEEYKRILNHIPGLVVVDNNGYIKFLSEDIQSRLLKVGRLTSKGEYFNKTIDEIHPLTKIVPGMDYGETGKFVFYQIAGIPNISKIKNIYENSTVVGMLDYDIAWGEEELAEFLESLDVLLSKKDFDLKKYLERKKKMKKMESDKYKIEDIIGSSEAMKRVKKDIYRVSKSESTVWIYGETGTGKELIAHSIHRLSKRGQGPLIAVNCASIPPNLMESEFFGYEEGSFSGAKKGGTIGKFEMANEGTIFLDEIDKLEYNLQSKLLRVLQEKEIDKIGGKIVPLNVRVIAASNTDLLEKVKANEFREDLYYRLNVLNIKAIPLRERKGDLRELASSFMEKYYIDGGDIPEIDEGVYDTLSEYDWPGNVREFFNVLERAINNCDGMCILSEHIEIPTNRGIVKKLIGDISTYNLNKIKEQVESEVIKEAMRVCKGNKKKASEMLGITRANLYSKIEKYNI
ncbi:MAG: sigma 54-interacting transcriptional regulator [Anaerovoracaceae bacterium]